MPRSTTLRLHCDSRFFASAGSSGSYLSTRPNGRAAAIAAAGPKAYEHRTDSASAPGTAPYGSRSWLFCTTERWSVRSAPIRSGSVSAGAAGSQRLPVVGRGQAA